MKYYVGELSVEGNNVLEMSEVIRVDSVEDSIVISIVVEESVKYSVVVSSVELLVSEMSVVRMEDSVVISFVVSSVELVSEM